MSRLTDTRRRTATTAAFTLAGAVAILLGIGGVAVGILGLVRGGGYGAVVWLTLVGIMMAFGTMLLYVGRARRLADRGSAGPREPAA